MAFIERRRNLWYATLTIPEDLRPHYEGKRRFVKSLGTPDKKIAEILAAPLISKWKSEFLRLRGISNPLHKEALEWLKELESKADDPYQVLIVEDFLRERTEKLEATKGKEAADTFHNVATGKGTLLNENYEGWIKQLDVAPKTLDQMKKDVKLFIDHFILAESVNKSGVRKWLDSVNKGIASKKRYLSFSRNFWSYLQAEEVVDIDNDPFTGAVDFKKQKKAAGRGSWVPFSPEEVVSLAEYTKDKGDIDLHNFIMLAAYTGCRIEELGSLEIKDITEDAFTIKDAKTEAGNRVVPIHSKIKKLVKSLIASSADGYLISGQGMNKYGCRSNAAGQRFGKLKKALGYSDLHVFHSFRKTFTTLLENAGVSENVAADIVGHEKPRITYGLYSGGATLDVKQKAIEKVKYPFTSKAK